MAKFVMMMSSAVGTLKSDVVEALQQYSDYAFLWEKDRSEVVIVRFCLYTVLETCGTVNLNES